MAALSMTSSEREAFLAGLHIGVLCVSRSDGGPPLAAPVWYAYEPGGEVLVVTGRDHEKTRLTRTSGQASLCAQTEEMPYRFVTVSGAAVVDEDRADPTLRRSIAVRYLGEEMGNAYIEATPDEDSVTLHIRPERWRTTDYSKL